MGSRTFFPTDLAKAVRAALIRGEGHAPAQSTLVQLFNTMFFTSLETEEGQTPRFEIVYADPANPDPKPPPRIRRERFSFSRFVQPIPFRSPELTKLAWATDYRTSSLAVYPDSDGTLQVWGLVDQGNTFDEAVNLEVAGALARPGLFQVTVLAPAHLSVRSGFSLIAELSRGELNRNGLDVSRAGPIRDALLAGAKGFLQRSRREDTPEDDWKLIEPAVQASWTPALGRILLRMQSFRHGGAILGGRHHLRENPR